MFLLEEQNKKEKICDQIDSSKKNKNKNIN